jgi:formylglycine-generating enzyme required for sulfatase activity
MRWAILAMLASLAFPANAAPTIDWVTVGDPENAADATGYGSVANSFQIMKYEFTNQQYAEFLNSVAATDTYSLYLTSMGSSARGGITRSGVPGSFSYAVKPNMEAKPVNFVSWWDAARVCNWLMNGGTSSASTETGAYELNGATSGVVPLPIPSAMYFIPTESQWYKAAYYKGGGNNSGYWRYATLSDSAPTAVAATNSGLGSTSGISPVTSGNFANFNSAASWNGVLGNVTTVGTNGQSGAYGTFDMNGNVAEWNDTSYQFGTFRGLRGGSWSDAAGTFFPLSSSVQSAFNSAYESHAVGFRLASPIAVPEPSTWTMGLTAAAFSGYLMWRRRPVH